MSKPNIELVPSPIIEADVERIEAPDDDRPSVGSWWWVKAGEKTDAEDCDRGRQWLGCVTEVGSNYAMLQGVRFHLRIALDDMPERCLAEPDPFAFIDGKINEHKTEVRQLMGKIQKVCAQLGVPMHEALTESNAASQALATTSGVANVKEYETALVKAKNKTLHELFKLVKEQHELMATWMQAELIPAKAELARAKDVTGRIESKIHMVELYAGLQEELVQVREGEPADVNERVHIRQRRCYMDEECLARYEAGGMDFDNVEEFDKWISRTENMVRLLPDKRSIVAFRIRRKDKNYGGERDTLANFIKFWYWNNANKQTVLYIRNGDQLWRMQTSMSFAEEIFPRADDHDLLGADEIWVSTNSSPVEFISGRRRLGMIESYHEERRDTARELWEWKRQGKPEKEWVMPGDKMWTWSSATGKSIQGRRFGRPKDRSYPHFNHYKLITPLHIYLATFAQAVEDEINNDEGDDDAEST